METIAGGVAGEAQGVRRKEVVVRAIAKELPWIQAAEICGITPRHMRRLKEYYQRHGYRCLVDGRGGKTRRKRVPVVTIEKLCELRRQKYVDVSVQHFWEKATEEHQLMISYTWAKLALQAAGLAEKSPARGKYRRRRERRPLRGMMLHLDGSTDEWVHTDTLPVHTCHLRNGTDGKCLEFRMSRTGIEPVTRCLKGSCSTD